MMTYRFNTERVTSDLINWIRDWFERNGGKNSTAVLGISGGKDSTIVGKLLVEAIGANRVFGVMLPNGTQHDLDTAKEVCNYLGLRDSVVWNIGEIYNTVLKSWENTEQSSIYYPGSQSLINLAPRLRMTALRFIAQMMNGRLINTSNLSEDWVGYATIDGDSAGDMSPLSMLTVQEVKLIGHFLQIPHHLVEKVPEDGLVGVSDEDNLGVSYSDIDAYIRKSSEISPKAIEIIEHKFKCNEFKLRATSGMPKFMPKIEDLYEGYSQDEVIRIPGLVKDFRINIWR